MSTAEWVGGPVEDLSPVSEAALLAEAPDVRAQGTFSEVFTDALRGMPTSVRGMHAEDQPLPVHDWLRDATVSDRVLLRHCRGATIDVGCGPGRMSAHLARLGHAVLAVDIVHEAVHQARRRGVPALRRNVFDLMPGEGRWDTILLADGNIGIGGDPGALLSRAMELVQDDGRVVVDLAPPGTGLRRHHARIVSRGRHSSSFPWAEVGVDAIADLAARCGTRVDRVREHHGRWFAVLVR